MTDQTASVAAQATPAPDVSQAQAVVTQASSDTQVVETTTVPTTVDTSPEGVSTTESTPKKNSAQERIQDLVAERNAAKEYAEYWRGKALEVIRVPASEPAKPADVTPTQAIADSPPTLAEFQYDQSKWAKAHGEWSKAIAKQEVRQELEAQRQQQSQVDLFTQYNDRVDIFRKDHSDFDIVLANPKLPTLDRIASAMVISSDEGAAITYHLAKNPEEATRIARLPPYQQALAIGRLENQVKAPKPAPVVQTAPAQTKPVLAAEVTKAPEPLAPVPAGGAASVDIESADVNTWMKARSADLRKRRRGGRVA